MSTLAHPPTIFESFNARALEPSEVAHTFVPPSRFRDLVRRCHTVVVGPRGSGKTTLLKMLQQPALEAWHHSEASEYRSQINYTGVFIPTDVNWKAQVESLGHGYLADDHKRLLIRAAFTTHVLRAVVTAMYFRVHSSDAAFPHRRACLDQGAEAAVVKEVAVAWHLEPVLPSLLALKRALSARLIAIGELASREYTLGVKGREQRFAERGYLHMPYLQAAAQAIEVFDDAINEQQAKWALLFDELELAPLWIRQDLISSMRSVDERFLFKLAISPYDQDISAADMLSPMQDADYEAIPLWYAHKEDGYDFCKALWKSLLEGRGMPSDDAEAMLGPSIMATPIDDWKEFGTAYRAGSPHQRRFMSLARKDSTFRSYLQKKSIDVKALQLLAGDERAAELRKVTAIVAVRDAFLAEGPRQPDGAQATVRSRKNPGVYSGTAAIFAMVEGNPRWLIGIANRLLANMHALKQISPKVQNREISIAANRFRAMLKTIPCQPIRGRQPPRGVLTLLDLVGRHFEEAIIRAAFNPDPPGSFTVDSRSDQSVIDTIGKALNTGAVVYVPDNPGDILLGASLRGKRFRLSYLLAENYHLPILLGRPVSLSHILTSCRDSKEDSESLLFPLDEE